MHCHTASFVTEEHRPETRRERWLRQGEAREARLRARARELDGRAQIRKDEAQRSKAAPTPPPDNDLPAAYAKAAKASSRLQKLYTIELWLLLAPFVGGLVVVVLLVVWIVV